MCGFETASRPPPSRLETFSCHMEADASNDKFPDIPLKTFSKVVESNLRLCARSKRLAGDDRYDRRALPEHQRYPGGLRFEE